MAVRRAISARMKTNFTPRSKRALRGLKAEKKLPIAPAHIISNAVAKSGSTRAERELPPKTAPRVTNKASPPKKDVMMAKLALRHHSFLAVSIAETSAERRERGGAGGLGTSAMPRTLTNSANKQ